MGMEIKKVLRAGACLGFAGLVATTYGCSDSSSPPEPPRELVLMTASPPTQTAEVGSVVGGPFVIVAEKDGLARVPGVVVTFDLTGGGTLSTRVDTTDAGGMARGGTWTLGATPGVSVVTALSPSVPDTVVVFTAEARAATSVVP